MKIARKDNPRKEQCQIRAHTAPADETISWRYPIAWCEVLSDVLVIAFEESKPPKAPGPFNFQ